MNRCGVFVLVGPGAVERSRLDDLTDSLTAWEPGVRRLLLVADRQPGLADHVSGRRGLPPVQVIDHPVAHAGSACGKVNSGVLAALQWISRHGRNERCWLKLDTDSLVIGPFADRLQQRFRDRPRAGIMGTCTRWPGGELRPYQAWHAKTLNTMTRRLGLWPSWLGWRQRLWLSLGARHRQRCEMVAIAREQGYRDGDHCQGGGYALSRAAIEALADRGWLDDVRLFFRTAIGEDVMVAMLVVAAGFEMLDFNRPGEVFAVQWRGLPASPRQLTRTGYAIAHSLKSWNGSDETELRRQFRELRSRAGR